MKNLTRWQIWIDSTCAGTICADRLEREVDGESRLITTYMDGWPVFCSYRPNVRLFDQFVKTERIPCH